MIKNSENALERFLSHLESVFYVSLHDAQEMISHFHREMQRGLAGENGSLKMIPSFIGRPKGTEEGRFLALDLGGTNIRVMAVDLDGNGCAAVVSVSKFVIPKKIMCGTGNELFDFIADCVKEFILENHINIQQRYDLAFTFSFPVDQHSIVSGKLIVWTKGFRVAGVEGQDVVTLLSEALLRKEINCVRVAALANDTVGTLVHKSYADPSCDMGVILGTGTNACYPEKIARILKCTEQGTFREMIVNMEWGGFNQLKTNIYDHILDSASLNPGKQMFEKMVSGMYLGEIARLVIVEMMEQGLLFRGTDPAVFSRPYLLTAKHLSMMAQGDDRERILQAPLFTEFPLRDVSEFDRQIIREVCRIVFTRAAQLAAAAIAAVVVWMDENLEWEHTVAIDGSLFEKYQGFRGHMIEILHDLFGDRGSRIKLELATDGSGIGSAIIAAVAAATRS